MLLSFSFSENLFTMMRNRERGNMFVLLFILIQMDISVAKTPRQGTYEVFGYPHRLKER